MRALVIVAVAALASGAAHAQQGATAAALFGAPAPVEGPSDRTVKIDARTRSVNVVQDDIVRFVVNGPGGEKTFAWHFATTRNAVDLSRIAPAGTFDRPVYVYLSPNPRFGCGS